MPLQDCEKQKRYRGRRKAGLRVYEVEIHKSMQDYVCKRLQLSPEEFMKFAVEAVHSEILRYETWTFNYTKNMETGEITVTGSNIYKLLEPDRHIGLGKLKMFLDAMFLEEWKRKRCSLAEMFLP